MKRFLIFLSLAIFPALLVFIGCGRPITAPAPPLIPTSTPTPLPCGPSAYVAIGSIGCKQNGLAVLRSQADWAAYQALPGCGTAVAGALDTFDFTDRMVISYDKYDCGSGPFRSIRITNVCFFADRIEMNITMYNGDAFVVDPDPNALVECVGDAVSLPFSPLPVVMVFCGSSGPPDPFATVTPCP